MKTSTICGMLWDIRYCGAMTVRFLYRRREFIAGLGSAAAWPVVAGAQQISVSTLFDGASHSLFDVLFGAGADRFPDATERAAVLTAVKDAARRWRGGPKAGHP
jgi:hypothetical protein